MEYFVYRDENEIIHWGVRGMKWGVRRYQNKDGSLTAAGKKHRAAEEAKLKERERNIKGREKARAEQAKFDAKKRELDAREKALKKGGVLNADNTKPKTTNTNKNSIENMTDEQLRAETNRMRLEKEYYDARYNLAVANPPKISAGKKFVYDMLDDVVVPAAKNVGKAWLEKTLKDALGVSDNGKKSSLPEVKTWDDMTKKQTWEEKNASKKNSKTDQQIEAIKSEIELLKQKKLLDDAKKKYKEQK